MRKLLAVVIVLTAAGAIACSKTEEQGAQNTQPEPAVTATPKAEPAVPSKPSSMRTVVDVAVGSPDHTTLVAALKQADLVTALNSPGGVYTIFAPTNAAFDKLPPGTVQGLMAPDKKMDLKLILQHHAGVPIMQIKDMTEGRTMAMADGKTVTFHVKDGKVMVDDANIVATIQAQNGVVHVIDKVLLPK